MVIKKFNRGDGKYTIGSQASINSGSSSSSTTTTTSTSDNYLWGNYNDGMSDIEDTIFVNGSVYAMPSKFEGLNEDNDTDRNEGDVDTYEQPEFTPFEDDNGGNVYAENLIKSFGDINADKSIEGNSVYGKTVYVNYNSVKTNILDLLLPVGSIIMFNGKTSIPNGWSICNGTNGTPDLRGKFVKGVGTESEVGSTGGSSTHTLTTNEMPSHNHNATTTINVEVTNNTQTTPTEIANKYIPAIDKIQEEYYDTGGSSNAIMYTGNHKGDYGLVGIKVSDLVSYSGGATGNGSATTTIDNTGSGNSFNIEPPYYSLIYIMKTG